ncbi:HDOD domain-containing protein [Hydrogenophaga palleronii]|uniref:HDOD domain-containing protein n=1 Tax=Hydrogenophaga palleronii TaxID=65655 RepID=UPI00082661AF|nr:HDOD domain-containing protein [Hydrogenophaga palleronii]
MSALFLVGLAALAAAALAAVFWWQRRAARSAVATAPAGDAAQAPGMAPAEPAPAQPPAAPLPGALASFQWRTQDQLDADKREALLGAIHKLPNPPQTLQQLLEPDLMARASATELHALIAGEPWIAVKVLASVNSPLYGLQTPVRDLAQAVNFLGLQSVRQICLQHLLATSFPARLPRVQRTLDALWRACTIASELAARLDKALHRSAQGPLSTQVVLSFVGQLATASVIPQPGLAGWLERDRLGRARLEQELLGLNASEIGHLLMQRWALPAPLLAEVREAGRVLVASPPPAQAGGGGGDGLPRQTLTYLCARLGERLALGQLASLEGYRPADDDSVDMHHLRASLSPLALARLGELLQTPALRHTVQQLTGRMAAA